MDVSRRRDGSGMAPRDRRAAPRDPRGRPVTIDIVGEPDWLACHLVEASKIGVGLRVPRPIDGGREFLLDVPSPAGRVVRATYRVVHCTPADGGGFDVGAALVGVTRGPAPRRG